jgi:hypothetical protein
VFFLFSTLEFPYRNIQFLIGLNDSINCKLTTPASSDILSSQRSLDSALQIRRSLQSAAPAAPTPGCNDNELATYCPAMLQGDNRYDRFIKWRNYINHFYHHIIYSNESKPTKNNKEMQDLLLSTPSPQPISIPVTTPSTLPSAPLPLEEYHLQLIKENHIILYVKNISHDPHAMLLSNDGKCLLFNYCSTELR